MKEEILPILKNYSGFFDLIPLDVETEFTRFYVISLGHDEYEAEIVLRYTKRRYEFRMSV